MKFYADQKARRSRQLLFDGFMVAWIALWAYIGNTLYNVVASIAKPARGLSKAGTELNTSMTDAGTSVSKVPLIDGALTRPFKAVAGVGTSLENTGNGLANGILSVATIAGWVTALTPILTLLVVWFIIRARFVRRASAAQALAANGEDMTFFALRALASQPVPRIAAITKNPGAAWAERDPEVLSQLAELELKHSGVSASKVQRRIAQKASDGGQESGQ